MSNCVPRFLDNRCKKLNQYVKYMVVKKLLSLSYL